METMENVKPTKTTKIEEPKEEKKQKPDIILMVIGGLILVTGLIMPTYRVVSTPSHTEGTFSVLNALARPVATYPLAEYSMAVTIIGTITICIGLYLYHNKKT